MFAKQVSSYCKTNGERQPALCKRELLMHGLGKLQSMDEISIDSMDPYQRGATDISKCSFFYYKQNNFV